MAGKKRGPDKKVYPRIEKCECGKNYIKPTASWNNGCPTCHIANSQRYVNAGRLKGQHGEETKDDSRKDNNQSG